MKRWCVSLFQTLYFSYTINWLWFGIVRGLTNVYLVAIFHETPFQYQSWPAVIRCMYLHGNTVHILYILCFLVMTRYTQGLMYYTNGITMLEIVKWTMNIVKCTLYSKPDQVYSKMNDSKYSKLLYIFAYSCANYRCVN